MLSHGRTALEPRCWPRPPARRAAQERVLMCCACARPAGYPPCLPAGRRSGDIASRASSAGSVRCPVVADTASTPERRTPASGAAGRSAAIAAAADQLAAASLEEEHSTGSSPDPAVRQGGGGSAAAAAAAQAAAEVAAVPAAGARPAAASPQQQRQQQRRQQQQQQQQQGAQLPPPLQPQPQLQSKQQQQQPQQPPASPGGSFFSVPMSAAPTSGGIFGIPQGVFTIRDLDAGKEYSMDQVGAACWAGLGWAMPVEWGAGGGGRGRGLQDRHPHVGILQHSVAQQLAAV